MGLVDHSCSSMQMLRFHRWELSFDKILHWIDCTSWRGCLLTCHDNVILFDIGVFFQTKRFVLANRRSKWNPSICHSVDTFQLVNLRKFVPVVSYYNCISNCVQLRSDYRDRLHMTGCYRLKKWCNGCVERRKRNLSVQFTSSTCWI